ncbi:hypothetical protein BJV82DRAFT_556863 [Fennellomyces sp. T-0311]|nr:hypothetical protein BJV82DRAFT_556863 [Fennellomyces sp. T-0311]
MDSLDSAQPNVMLALGPPEQRQQKAPAIASHDEQQKTRWTCHKTVLAKHSPYFAAMFDGEFCESGASIVFLPPGVFTAIGLDSVLHYMYTNEVVLNVNGSPNETYAKVQQLQDMYSAADYLGMTGLKQTVTRRLSECAHQWTCYCSECRDAVTQLFPYSYSRAVSHDDEQMAVISEKTLIVLTQEPDKALHTYWTSRGLADMITVAQPDVGSYLNQQIIGRISRFNAIETLHACFLANKTLAPTPSDEYRPLKSTVAAAQARSTEIIAHYFDFYCSQYPTLLSCIDGITYSFDFLEFLLQQTLQDNMRPHNAPTMYQGIVRDLMCRHAVQHCAQVKLILTDARSTVLRYIMHRLDQVTKCGAFDRLDKNVLVKLAEDTMMPPKAFATIQSRRPSGTGSGLKRSSTAEFRTSAATISSSDDTGHLRKLFHWFTSITKLSSEDQKQQAHVTSKKSKLAPVNNNTAPEENSSSTDGSSSAAKKLKHGLKSPIGKRRILLVRRPLTSP